MTDIVERTDRQPGLSTPDLLRADPSGVPDVWLVEALPDVTAGPVGFHRYTSAQQAELEEDRLWGRVWQWA